MHRSLFAVVLLTLGYLAGYLNQVAESAVQPAPSSGAQCANADSAAAVVETLASSQLSAKEPLGLPMPAVVEKKAEQWIESGELELVHSNSPQQRGHADKILASYVEQWLLTGSWTEADRGELLVMMGRASPAQRQRVHTQVVEALNSGQIEFDFAAF